MFSLETKRNRVQKNHTVKKSFIHIYANHVRYTIQLCTVDCGELQSKMSKQIL